VGKEAHLEEAVVSLKSKTNGETVYRVNFEWDESQGIPGAVLVKNLQHAEIYLKTITLEGVPGKGTVVFVANSWVFPHKLYTQDRIFFANDVSIPTHTSALTLVVSGIRILLPHRITDETIRQITIHFE
jgi:linoleate 9S-lipoxygenase